MSDNAGHDTIERSKVAFCTVCTQKDSGVESKLAQRKKL